jgi:diguanylate cyclase (GGDEF)-like protein/PAS domain S-box-containing protein
MWIIKKNVVLFPKVILKLFLNNLGYLFTMMPLIFIGCYFGFRNEIMFHIVIRLVSVLLSLLIFSTSFNTYNVSKDKDIMFFGITYILVSYFIFASLYCSNTTNNPLLSNQLDMTVLYFQIVSFLTLFIFTIITKSNYKLHQIASVLIIIAIICTICLINRNLFPAFPLDNAGLTSFMRISQYFILGTQLITLILIFTYRVGWHSFFIKYITTFFIISAMSEILFIFSQSTYDLYNIIGNILKIISLYIIHRMVIERSLKAPYKQLQEYNRELNIQKTYFEKLFGDDTQAIAIINNSWNITNINKGFTDLFKYSLNEALNHTTEELIVPDHLIAGAEDYNNYVDRDENFLIETTRKCKDGSLVEVSLCGYPIIVDNERIGAYAIYRDISNRKKAEKELIHLSFHDSLTGMYNRIFLEEEIKRLDVERLLPLSVIMGDVDGLKFANDIFGHKEGDNLLICISQILKSSCRTEDVIARIGGDEFIILLPQTSSVIALGICNRIKDNCLKSSNTIIQPHISLGTATKLKLSQDIGKLLNRAEDKMYRAKTLDNKNIRNSIIDALKRSHWRIDNKTEEHAKRLETLSREMGQAIGLSENQLSELCLLARIHDLGKIAIPNEILNKPGKLTNEEWDVMKRHPEIGYRIAQFSHEMNSIADGVLYHHEKWDGTGYPEGLKNVEIPLLSRIISVIDSYDAMTNDRVYQRALGAIYALNEIKRCSGTQFDPYIVKTFIEVMEKQNLIKNQG